MSGFEQSWLALREPADRAARDEELARFAAQRLAVNSQPHVMDIGCGTGSTYRALSTVFPQHARWTLVDYDEKLLDHAQQRVKNASVLKRDLRDLSTLPLDGVSVLTASAFFDLASADFCEQLAGRLAATGAGFYAALNYDGLIEFAVAHELDRVVVRDFNTHQRRDKGFGPALGPQAGGHLAGAFRSLHYQTRTASSPWMLGSQEAELQRAFLTGMVAPVCEVGHLPEASVRDWLDFRLAHIHRDQSCLVGHTDFLAWKD